MRIAFTSCCLLGHDPEQTTWKRIGNRQPDWLVLMGDSIYMDYFPDLNAGEDLTDKDFGLVMQSKYQNQFEHPSFGALFRGQNGKKPKIFATWDDHDFAWNNSYGEPGHKHSVPEGKKKIARALYIAFLKACRDGLEKWPLQNIDSILVSPPVPEGIYQSEDFAVGDWSARLVVLDGRYHRRKPALNTAGALSDMLGDIQAEFLRDSLLGNPTKGIARPDLALVVSGTTLQEGGESWKAVFPGALQEFLNLTDQHGAVIVLSGDIHELRFNRFDGHPHCVEAVASGAGIRKYLVTGMRKNFGLLDLSDERKVVVSLFNKTNGDDPAGQWSLSYSPKGDGVVPLVAAGIGTTPLVATLQPLKPDVDNPIPSDVNPHEFLA